MVERCDFRIGEAIGGKYTVRGTLGEGAFGKVFRVTNSAGSTYALKLLKLWEVSPDIRQQLSDRFEMEYQTGRIDSPYLVHSIDHGFAQGNPYIIMEFCPNGDLTQCGRNADWITIARQVLLGLKALHAHGKVHRDLKPENVLIKQDGTAVLTDFGISGDRNKRMTERNIVGKPMQIFGTYAYMPPEQVQPKRGDATVLPTTDIFSFGVMMYQLLTGKLPFGTLNTEADLALYIKRAGEGDWHRSPLSLSAYGTTFLPIIEGCLRPDFKQRLQSTDAVLQMLPTSKPMVADNSVPATPAHITGYRLRIMQGEEYGKIYNLTALHSHTLTMGRESGSVQNTLPIVEAQSRYISRKHCTLNYDPAAKCWQIYDGQQDAAASNGWKYSLNGTFVNSTEVGPFGYWLRVGDIISIGDTKLRMEAY